MVTMDKRESMDPCAFDKLFTKSVPHIFEKIFFSLDYISFKNCKEVNNSWNELLTSESFKGIGKAIFHKFIGADLIVACLVGNINEVKRIISSGMADVNCIYGPHDATPLHYASWKVPKMWSNFSLIEEQSLI